MRLFHLGIEKIEGPLIILRNINDAFYDEMVLIKTTNDTKKGKVVLIEGDKAAIEVFDTTGGLSLNNIKVSLEGHPVEMGLSPKIIGRIFNGSGDLIDSKTAIKYEKFQDINSSPINPVSRIYPKNYIQTGFSAIDGLITLIRGQKLPIFSVAGLPHEKIAASIAINSKLTGIDNSDFCVVFCAIGVNHDTASFFKKSFEDANIMNKTVMFINTSSDPIIERILTPRCALTVAEYLAFSLNKQVLVIMSDITSYCEALREFSSSKGEIPGRKGFPGYMYSDLASLYERAGIIKTSKGSITQIPILTMPNEDITHPIPDLTGYITEGQIVLSKDLYKQNIYPPISILPSLSRLAKDGIGKDYTRLDHQILANQIFASYSRSLEVKSLVSIVGEDELNSVDKKHLLFASYFDTYFINQDKPRDMISTLDLGWHLLSLLPKSSLTNVPDEILNTYYDNEKAKAYFKLKDSDV